MVAGNQRCADSDGGIIHLDGLGRPAERGHLHPLPVSHLKDATKERVMTDHNARLVLDHLQAIRASMNSVEAEIESIIEILDRIVARVKLNG